MFLELPQIPWLYVLAGLAYLSLAIGFFWRKALLPLVLASLATFIAFLVCGIVFEIPFPVLAGFASLEGILFFLPMLPRKKEAP